MKVLLFFIDGFGIGPANPEINPIFAAKTPVFDSFFAGKRGSVVPTLTDQGVKGIPQSATGQTALLTGVPAARIMGRHISGFPGPGLRKIIEKKNILKQLRLAGLSPVFANAYTPDYLEKVRSGEVTGSVTTVCTFSAGLPFRKAEQIIEGKAVYQDFTNYLLQKKGLDIPLMEPEEAGANLAGIVKEHDFTLYEYFQTDLYGHRQDMEKAVKLIEQLDRFLNGLINSLDFKETLLVISSDHGNIEDLSLKTHTMNPVPTILEGLGADIISDRIREITDITPAIISLLEG